MKIILRIIYESLRQAMQQLKANKLRSFLSLLGITIGIFCIIGVQSAVDSLQDNIMGSLNKLGDDVVYVSKMPWNEDPGQNWWKYQRRPNPDYDDLLAIQEKVKTYGYAEYHLFLGMKTLKYRSSSVEGAFLLGCTYDFEQVFNIEFEKGRYLSPTEYHYGANKVVIGHQVSEELFGSMEPIGKTVKMGGKDLEVVGVIKKSGKDLLKIMDFDQGIIIGYELAKKITNVKTNNPWAGSVNVKAAPGVSMETLQDDLIGALRAERQLKPKEENDFALNTLSILANLFDSFFAVLNTIGFIIGIFAIIVGMVSVANIMFVSVKERTNIIGIKKALGAKRNIILLEFLIESIVLCLIGGVFGLAFVFSLFKGLESVMPFPIYVDFGNVLFGVGLSVLVGILSGLIPAFQAARMDPVVAIRQGG